MISRRKFMALSSLMMMIPRVGFSYDFMPLRAGPAELKLMSDEKPTNLWGYNGSTPGPVIRAKKGDRIQVRFENGLSQNSSIHWHGVRIDNRMDGVPGLTQSAVTPGRSFDYDFTVPDAGTYWYHSHDRSWEQVARGLYGVLIVDEEIAPLVSHDIIVCVDDWRVRGDGSQKEGYNGMHDRAHEGRLGNVSRALFEGIEGKVKRNQRVRMRVINTATARVFRLRFEGLEGKIVAYDGMPLEQMESLGSVTLAPSQRVDVIAEVSGDRVAVYDRGEYLGGLRVEGEGDKVEGEIESLQANRYRAPDMNGVEKVPLLMEGGAMSGMMMRGMMSGMMSGMMESMMGGGSGGMMGGNSQFWTFNGKSGRDEVPLRRFKRGETGVIDFINDTRFSHAMHVHGHHFQAVSSGGRFGPLRDTVLVEAGERQEVACVFENPGKWLLHCHMLGHQASGMVTWLEVE